jgi:hypothetical protein
MDSLFCSNAEKQVEPFAVGGCDDDGALAKTMFAFSLRHSLPGHAWKNALLHYGQRPPAKAPDFGIWLRLRRDMLKHNLRRLDQ